MLTGNQVSAERLEKALKIAARIVMLYGETYLPIFNRIHEEMKQIKDKKNTQNIALNLAKVYAEIE